ncbi:MAG: thermonuclease family protein [Chloroflexi bacterium]|nr:thermonuclease family protein [Chloroflexota bacterium]
MKRVMVFALALLAFLAGCAPAGVDALRVERVVDGDTVVITGGAHLRYIGIDTPERDMPFYGAATEANRRLVRGKAVRLEKDVSDRDRYGRLLRYVYVGDVFVNLELVRQGWAEAKAYPPDIRHQAQLAAAEREARAARRGIWQEGTTERGGALFAGTPPLGLSAVPATTYRGPGRAD